MRISPSGIAKKDGRDDCVLLERKSLQNIDLNPKKKTEILSRLPISQSNLLQHKRLGHPIFSCKVQPKKLQNQKSQKISKTSIGTKKKAQEIHKIQKTTYLSHPGLPGRLAFFRLINHSVGQGLVSGQGSQKVERLLSLEPKLWNFRKKAPVLFSEKR